MTTLQSPVAAPPSRIARPKGKMVKPILKKLSHPEKNSLDLDRGWEDQQMGPPWGGLYEAGGAGRSARDVSFAMTDGSESVGGGSKARFTHVRSPSGASVATSGSGGLRTGTSTFVHPFQQTPRTSTPPLSYAHSFDNGHTREHSPTITENEDGDDYASPTSQAFPPTIFSSSSSHHHHHHHPALPAHSASTSNLRRPSLVSQRTASSPDITAVPQLRIGSTRSAQNSSRLVHGSLTSSLSHSDLQLNLALSSLLDSPHSTTGPHPPPPIASPSPSASIAPMSPLRSSLESVGFPRLRSRSEVDAGARAEHIREARRKFEARERAKEEKHDREMLRKRERRDHKEAKELERQAATQLRKNSTDTAMRLSTSRTDTSPTPAAAGQGEQSGSGGSGGSGNSGRSGCRKSLHHDQPQPQMGEKEPVAFLSSNYESMAGGTTPNFVPAVDNVRFEAPPRRNTAKRKTQSYWTGFILWLRTRLFRLGRK